MFAWAVGMGACGWWGSTTCVDLFSGPAGSEATRARPRGAAACAAAGAALARARSGAGDCSLAPARSRRPVCTLYVREGCARLGGPGLGGEGEVLWGTLRARALGISCHHAACNRQHVMLRRSMHASVLGIVQHATAESLQLKQGASDRCARDSTAVHMHHSRAPRIRTKQVCA